jgi:hypothetical protein
VRGRGLFNPNEKQLIAFKLRQCGMACIQRVHDIEYIFEEDTRQSSETMDDSGLPGVRVITRDEIIARINRNQKLSKSQKKVERDILLRRLDREVRTSSKSVVLRRD